MISFLIVDLLKSEQNYCNFMLKYNIENYFPQIALFHPMYVFVFSKKQHF